MIKERKTSLVNKITFLHLSFYPQFSPSNLQPYPNENETKTLTHMICFNSVQKNKKTLSFVITIKNLSP